jgi:hypothetical protein
VNEIANAAMLSAEVMLLAVGIFVGVIFLWRRRR